MLFSVVLIPQLGTQNAERALIVVSIVAAIVVFASLAGSRGAAPADDAQDERNPVAAGIGELVAVAVGLIIAIALTTRVPKVPDGLDRLRPLSADVRDATQSTCTSAKA